VYAPGLVKGPAGARSIAAATNQTIVVTESGRIWTWGHVRAWHALAAVSARCLSSSGSTSSSTLEADPEAGPARRRALRRETSHIILAAAGWLLLKEFG
jgi:hypothetical protein